jgi:hypothetical protein
MPHLPARRFSSPVGRAGRALCAAAILVAAACSGGEPSGTGTNPPLQVGSLTITVVGLPGSAAATITVSGPAGFTRSVAGTTTLGSLAPGAYELSSSEVTAATSDIYAAAQPTMSVGVTAGGSASATVSYALVSGSLALTVAGLPPDASAAVSVGGPDGFSRTVTATSTLGGLRPGSYTILAGPVNAIGHTFSAGQPSVTVEVPAGAIPISSSINYAIASGAVVGSLTGLPTGSSPMLVLNGPGGATQTVAPGATVTNLAPGSYTLTGTPVTVGVDTYGVPTPTPVTVAASATPVPATVQYALVSGRLAVSVSGLPAGANGAVVVTGPAGYQQSVEESETLTGLTPGSYTIAAANVGVGAQTYQPLPASQQVTVSASTTPAAASVVYAVNSGSLSVIVNGLSQSIPAAIVVTGPQGYTANVATTTLLGNLKPGTYTVTASATTAGLHVYAPTPTTQQISVAASATAATANVQYALNSGMLQITVTGLPGGVASPIAITGPAGYSASVTSGSLLTGLKPGQYSIAASMAQNGSLFWAPNPANQTATVVASISAVQATVNYATANGGLNVVVNGLPGGVNASVQITGPGGFSQNITTTTTLPGLLQGLYTATATSVTNLGSTYTGSPATQNVLVGGGVTSNVIVTYTLTGGPPPPPPAMNLTIDGMHVQQVVQSYTGTVPLIGGRNGLLRVFVKAGAANTATPAVRVRFYDGASLTSTITITAPGGSVPTTITEGTLGSSWNYTIPAALVQPNLRILADVDPTNAVVESSESDNAFPVSGVAATMDVRTVSDLDVRLVPITQSVNGNTGVVNAGNAAQFMSETGKVFPLNVMNVDVRAAYTTAAPVLQNNDGNGAWSQILSELNALRTADGSTRYYVGVVKVGYSSGIAGLGYVPGRSTLTWDHIGSADGVVAHELGHNFGRFHAPCGGPGGPDPSYPYAGGLIGVYGYDIAANTLKNPGTVSDLMGYCNNTWISDYTFNAVLAYRTTNPFIANAPLGNQSPRRGLLVWGRIEGGRVILEPAFEVDARPALPARAGRHRLQAFGPLGESLLDMTFDGERVPDLADPTVEHFSFVVPFDMLGGTGPSRLRLSARGQVSERRASRSASPTPSAERVNSQTVRIRWQDSGLTGVLVRDARTGEILAFARGGEILVRTSSADVDLVVSDGVRSTRERVRVRN